MSDGLLTIVTITRNESTGLRRSVESARKLRSMGIEHIIVDGSDDEVYRDNQSMVAAVPGLELLRQTGRGISAAFNEAMQCARGEWIWYINGGDEVHPELDHDFFMSSLRLSAAEGIIFEIDCRDYKTERPPICFLWPPIVNWVPHPGVLLRTSVLRRFNGFNEDFRYAMDAELWTRMLHKHVRFDLVSYPVALFSMDGVSGQGSRSARELMRIFKSFRWRIFKRWIAQLLRIRDDLKIIRRIIRRFPQPP